MKPRVAGESSQARAAALGIRAEYIDDEFMKLLNLGNDLLLSVLPFVLGKVNRVSYGLLSPNEIEKALQRYTIINTSGVCWANVCVLCLM